MSFWWLDLATAHALQVVLIAAVYIGFAVSDGRPRVIAIESAVAAAFFVVSAVAVAATPWLLVAAYLAHGGKDLWQHRQQLVRGTRWWPPFCFAVDLTVAAHLALGTSFQSQPTQPGGRATSAQHPDAAAVRPTARVPSDEDAVRVPPTAVGKVVVDHRSP